MYVLGVLVCLNIVVAFAIDSYNAIKDAEDEVENGDGADGVEGAVDEGEMAAVAGQVLRGGAAQGGVKREAASDGPREAKRPRAGKGGGGGDSPPPPEGEMRGKVRYDEIGQQDSLFD